MRVSRDAAEAIKKLVHDAQVAKAEKSQPKTRELRSYTSPPGRVPDTSDEDPDYTASRNRFWSSLRKKVALPAKSVKL